MTDRERAVHVLDFLYTYDAEEEPEVLDTPPSAQVWEVEDVLEKAQPPALVTIRTECFLCDGDGCSFCHYVGTLKVETREMNDKEKALLERMHE